MKLITSVTEIVASCDWTVARRLTVIQLQQLLFFFMNVLELSLFKKKKIIKHERLQQTPPLGGVDERSFHSFNCFVFYLELYAVSFGYFLPHSPPSSFVFLFVFFFTFLFSGLFVQIQLSNSLFLIHFVSGWYVFDFYLINKATSTSPSDNISLLQF